MSEKVGQALREFFNKNLPMQVIAAKVISVDESEFTCDADPVDGGATIGKIRLKPVIDSDDKGMIVIPTKDSYILIGLLMNKDTQPFMVQWSKAEKVMIRTNNGATLEMDTQGRIKINGDSLGGLVKVRPLKTGLDKNNLVLNALLTVIKSAPIPEPGSGSPSAFQQALNAAVSLLQLGDFSEIENSKVMHGA